MAPAPLGGRYSAIKYLSLGFNYDFDLWGGERAAWEAALGQANAARIDSQAARIGLSASIARATATSPTPLPCAISPRKN